MSRRREPQVGLGRAIRTFRTADELSQETLAFRAKFHPTWISHVESGRINPSWGSVRRIASGLYVPLSELATLAEELERRAV